MNNEKSRTVNKTYKVSSEFVSKMEFIKHSRELDADATVTYKEILDEMADVYMLYMNKELKLYNQNVINAHIDSTLNMYFSELLKRLNEIIILNSNGGR